MDNATRAFVFSSPVFGGFQVDIDLSYVGSKADIVRIATDQLRYVFEAHKLRELLEQLKTTTFCIHTTTFAEILASDPRNVCYICDGCPGSGH